MNLKKILEDHKLWLDSNRIEGKRIDLWKANLSGASLWEANLKGADLWGANLK